MTAVPLSRHVDPLVVGEGGGGAGVVPSFSQIDPNKLVLLQSLSSHFPSFPELPVTQSFVLSPFSGFVFQQPRMS